MGPSWLQIATAEEFANAGDVIMSPEVARTLLNHCEVELLERDNARLISMHTTAEVRACLLTPAHALLLCRGLSAAPMCTAAGVSLCPLDALLLCGELAVSSCPMQTWTTVWWAMCGGCCAEEAPVERWQAPHPFKPPAGGQVRP